MTSIGRAQPHRETPDGGGEGWKAGVALAGVAGLASLRPSLLPRSNAQQAIVTVASAALGYGVGVGATAIANRVDDSTDLDALGARLAVGGAGALGALGLTFALRGRPNLALESARTTAGVIGAGAATGAALVGEQALADDVSESVPGGATAAHAAVLGAAALGAGALALGRVRGSAVTKEAEAAYLASVGGAQGSTKSLATFDEARFTQLQQLRSAMRTESGQDAGTLLPDGLVGTSGFRFINEATPAAEIARVMGVEPAAAKDPIRIYGGMRHAPTHDELAQKIFDEALAKGAFDRSHVVLYVPSGTGHVNPMPVAATEYLTHGDVASIGMQYYNKPSLQAFHKVGAGRDLFDGVLRRVTEHVKSLPADQRPIVSTYGESLGAWSMQDAFRAGGATEVASRGVDNLISVGTPRFSKLRTEAIGPGGHRMDATGTLFEFDNLDELRALAPNQRAGVRSYLLSHYNDPVNKFSPRMFVQRPEWLGSIEHAMGVPRKMTWIPGVSGVQGVIDMANGARVIPGILERTGHDYRADMAPAMAEILALPSTKSQMSRINDALNQLELARIHEPLATPHFPAPASAAH